MSKNKSYLETLDNISLTFEKTKDNITYQREQLIKFKDSDKIFINFSQCHVAICPNGGLIAVCKKKGYLDITKGSKINKYIIIMHQNLRKKFFIPIDWPYFQQYFVLLDFNEKEQLYGICNDASIFKIDILTQRAIPKVTSELLRQETIAKARLYKDGFVALTGEGKFYYMKEIKNPVPDLIIEMKSIFKFSNNIDFLIIPEEVSKSKKLELLITNETGYGVVHVEKTEYGTYCIVPINEIYTDVLKYEHISIIRKDKLEPYLYEDDNPESKSKPFLRKSTAVLHQHDNLKKIKALAISPSKKNIAMYDINGIVYFFSSTLDLYLEKNPRIKSKIVLSGDVQGNEIMEQQMVINFSENFQFLFCGEDTVALFGLRLIFLINKTSNSVIYKITDKGENDALNGKLFAKLIQEVDGVRYISDEGMFLISKTNKDLLNICDPFIKSYSKKLLTAYEYYLDQSSNCEKILREIESYLPQAINSLQIAAGNIFWTEFDSEDDVNDKKDLQFFLLKAAQFGKIYLNVNEFNFDKFVNICKDIKVVNNLRNHLNNPRLISFIEYKNMESKDLIRKLMRNLNFGMAFELCHFLNYSDKKVYQKFAIARIKKISKIIDRKEEEEIANSLNEKLKNVPNISYIKLAKKAFKYKKMIIGDKFLQNEKSNLTKIPLYIENKDWDIALDISEEIYDRNIINTILHKIYIVEGEKKFIENVSSHNNAKSAVIDFINENNDDLLEKYMESLSNPEDKLYFYLEKYFSVTELKERKTYLNKAKECLKLINNAINPNFEHKFYKNYIESLENNINFKTGKEYKGKLSEIVEEKEDLLFDISIYDTYKLLIKDMKEPKYNLFEKYNNKNFGYSQEGMSILKLTVYGEDEKFLEMDSYIKKYSSLKKIGLTNLNMAEIYYKCKNYHKAVEYIKNVNDSIYINYKINMLEYIEKYEDALEVIISEKNLANPVDLINRILARDPSLKDKIDQICEKYKVKLKFD